MYIYTRTLINIITYLLYHGYVYIVRIIHCGIVATPVPSLTAGDRTVQSDAGLAMTRLHRVGL